MINANYGISRKERETRIIAIDIKERANALLRDLSFM